MPPDDALVAPVVPVFLVLELAPAVAMVWIGVAVGMLYVPFDEAVMEAPQVLVPMLPVAGQVASVVLPVAEVISPPDMASLVVIVV